MERTIWGNLSRLTLAGAALTVCLQAEAQPGGPLTWDNKTNREAFGVTMSGAFMVPESASTNTVNVTVTYEYLSLTGTNYTYVEGIPFPQITPVEIGRLYTNDTAVSWRVRLETNHPALSCGVYGPAASSQRGALLFDFGEPAIATNILTIDSGPNGASSSTNYSLDFAATSSCAPDQMRQLEAGLYYAELASINFPTGEMRAQLSKQPVLRPPRWEQNGTVSFKVSKPPYMSSTVEVSTNMQEWSVLTNLSASGDIIAAPWGDVFMNASGGIFDIGDPEATGCQSRFYRAILPP